jgi:Ca-activated chloride channel family protein
VDEVTSLAKVHGIITPYTSYLIVEDEDRQVRQHRLPEERRALSSTVREAGNNFTLEKKKEYEAIHAKSGAPSTRASSEIQALTRSQNSDQIAPGGSRLSYTVKNGSRRNLAQQVRTIGGKTFYYTGSGWIDIALQQVKGSPKKRSIRFGSSDYFDLLKKSPETAPFMALGKKVTFVLNATVFDIYE